MAPAAHEHVCQVARSEDDLVATLRTFLKTLVDRDGIFIHRYSAEDAQRLLALADPDESLRREATLTVATREAAFQGPYPRIHHEHVAETVQAAVAAAQSRKHGLAILADASHAYIKSGRAQEWFDFETWLGRRLDQDIVLVCLYWQADLERPEILDGMMRTHLARLSARGTRAAA